jgi:hypothetical protein
MLQDDFMLEIRPGGKDKRGEAAPEKEIEELKSRIEKLESELKKEKPPVQEKIVKREIKNYIEEVQKTPSFAPPVSTRDEAEEIAKFQPSQQVGALVSLVFQKGLSQAVSVAKQLDNPAILDEFHDILVDRYYKEMVKRGIIK